VRSLRAIAPAVAVVLLLAAASTAGAVALGSRTLRNGSRGSDVVALQRALVTIGYRIAADGIYGPRTTAAVLRYERVHHIKVDGMVSSPEARMILRSAKDASKPGGTTSGSGGTPPPPVQVPPSPPPSTGDTYVFPVRGSYDFGGPGNRFGAPRGTHTHQGQDIMAAEGTPVASVGLGTVYWRAYQAAGGGNYVVIRGGDGRDYVYMHFRSAAAVAPGDAVTAGQIVGYVGHTGDATVSHLHFEIWAGHWQGGGSPIDPLPYLQAWAG
jgi:murein DD-endopeptidase MepM/ murein hydrolase activator NlpD